MMRGVILGLNCVVCIVLNGFRVGGKLFDDWNLVQDEILF